MENSHNLSSSSVHSRRIENVDAHDQAISLRAWNHNYTQLSVGAFAGSIEEFELGSTIIYRESLNQAVMQSGTTAPEMILIGTILAMEGDAFYNGTSFDRPVVLTMLPERDFEFRSPITHEIVAASITVSDFESYAAVAECIPAEKILACLKPVSCNSTASKKLSALFRLSANACMQSLTDQQAILAAAEIRSGIFECLADCSYSEELHKGGISRVAGNRVRIFRRVDQFIREHPGDPIDIETLCRVASTSRRTLQYCFETVAGVNPIAYLRCYRLNGVRNAIRQGASGRNTADIAADWGFWHHSNFSACYKQMFGELPSETAANSARLH